MREKNTLEKDKAQITKKKILDAAIEVFSEKSFEGARVDEIAARAKVNKAMLYYYFESKENLFEELVKQFKDEAKAIKQSFISNTDLNEDKNVEALFQGMYEFIDSKKEVLRIIMIESLKANSKDVTIFSTLLPSVEMKLSRLKNKGVEVEDIVSLMVNSFFFLMVPASVYLVLGDRWADFYGFDKEETKRRFLEKFKQIRKEYLLTDMK